MGEIGPTLNEGKPTAQFPFGLTSTLLGFFLLISSCVLYFLPWYLAGPDGNLSDAGVQETSYFVFGGYLCSGVSTIPGMFLGIIGVRKKTTWSWAGIILNLIAFCVTPVLFLLTLLVLATA